MRIIATYGSLSTQDDYLDSDPWKITLTGGDRCLNASVVDLDAYGWTLIAEGEFRLIIYVEATRVGYEGEVELKLSIASDPRAWLEERMQHSENEESEEIRRALHLL